MDHAPAHVHAHVVKEPVYLMALYETEDGQPIVTHSMIKTFRRCPKQTQYKYVERLKPKHESAPLKRGKWIHALLEVHYKGGDWKEEHKRWVSKYRKLFEEEQEKLGDLPREIAHLMDSYFWHYRYDEDWKVLETEFTIECELPDGTLYRGRVDNLVETRFGLYVVDHKSHKSLPDTNFRLIDAQSALYIWAANKLGIPVQGFIWNYIKYLPPKPLKFNKNGTLSKRQGDTDYPTAYRSIKAAGFDPKEERFAGLLKMLKSHRYQPDSMQLSPFFRRDTLEKSNDVIQQVVREAFHTTKRMHKYPFHKPHLVERVPDRSCSWMCSFKDLCTAELMGGNADNVRRLQFKEGDPMEYYYDQKEEEKDA